MKKSTKMYLWLFAGLLATNLISKTLSKGMTHLIDDIRAEERLAELQEG